MHFYPTVHFLIPDIVFEMPEVKVSPEFPIDPGEQIEIERRSHSSRIIIGQHHVMDRFLHISSQ